MKNSKRILSVKIVTVADNDPDTSYFGEYSDRATSRFSIDRKHSEECQSQEYNHKAGLEQLERIISYLSAVTYSTDLAEEIRETASEAQDVLIGLQDEMQECDCVDSGDMRRHEYRFFNPSFNYVQKGDKLVEGLTEEDVRQYVQQDYERMESLHRGNWAYIGLRAVAKVQLTGDLTQEFSSGGLYGIESDSDKDYIQEVEQEELFQLRKELVAVGFKPASISNAFKNLDRREE